jgi:hypothetical protein
MTNFPPKTILMWANQDPQHPNSFIIKNGQQKLLGLTRVDKKGQTYWKFKERRVKNSPEPSLVMDNIQKFQQRQAKVEQLNNHGNNNNNSEQSALNRSEQH